MQTAALQEISQHLTDRINAVKNKQLTRDLWLNIALSFLVFSAIAMLLVIMEAIFNFSSSIRTIFFFGFFTFLSASIIYSLFIFISRYYNILSPVNIIEYSKKVGSYYPPVKDKISNSLSLAVNGSSSFSSSLVYENLSQVKFETDGLDLSSHINYSNVKKICYYLISSLFIYAFLFMIFSPDMSNASNRLLNYNYNFVNERLGLTFQISPGNTEAASGSDVTVIAAVNSTLEGFKADEITLYTKVLTKDGVEITKEEIEVKANEQGVFAVVLQNITNDLIYYAEYEGIVSEKYTISVSHNPIIKSFFVTVFPPQFTGAPSKTLSENEGNITASEGSTIYFDINSNKDLAEAYVVLNGNNISLPITGNKASGSIAAAQGNYHFLLKDMDGRENKDKKEYFIKVLKDEPPKISIIEPSESNFVLQGSNEVLIRTRISDDHGFSGLKLFYSGSSSNSSAGVNFHSVNIPIKNLNATSLEVPYLWMLSLTKGRQISYYLEVTDNTGKTAKSDVRTISYKSITELLKESKELAKELKSDLESVQEDANELEKNVNDLKEKMQNNEELGLNDGSKQQLQKNVENLQNKLNTTQQKIDQGMQDLQEKNMLSDKTLEQYMKLQELFSKINTEELREMLKKMQEALKNNDREQLKDALKNFKFDEEAFNKQMEKVMELMKKIENLQKFGELTQKLDDITQKQDELKRETEQTDQNNKEKMNELSDKQNNVKEELDNFKEELQKLIDEMNKMKDKDMNPSDLEKLKQEMEKQKTENKMQESSNQLQNNQKQNSEQKQQEIMNDLNGMNQKMQNALSEMIQNNDQQQKMMQKLQDLKQQLGELSKQQQELKEKTEETENGDKQQMEQNRGEQKELQDKLGEQINDLMNTMQQGNQITPELGKELGNAYNQMDKAGNNMKNGQKQDATGNQGNAKQSLDKAGDMLGDMVSKMQQQGKDGENGKQGSNGKMGQLMQQLANLIAQQQGLNSQMQQMGQDGKTGKDGTGQNSDKMGDQMQMQKMKLQQEQISKSLEQLNKEFEIEKQRSGEKLLGNLNEVQKEMEEVIKDLSNNNMSRETLERQNKILSRMLDAQLSQREKDFEKKRESKPGSNYNRVSPPEIVLSGPSSINALKEEILRLQKEGYNEDYEALISKYLQEINK